MAPLKENLRYHLKKYHMGMENAVTIRDLAVELLPIRVNTMQIREAIGILLVEGVSIILLPELPVRLYYADNQEEARRRSQSK